jgi:co-chaperonin GroES (HSP10)
MSLIEMPGLAQRPRPTYKPYGHIIQLDWSPEEVSGGIHIPKSAQRPNLPFYRVQVLAVGPDVKLVKQGDWVLLPSQVILTAKWDGHTAYFSSEDKILGVVDLVPMSAPLDLEKVNAENAPNLEGNAGSSAQ